MKVIAIVLICAILIAVGVVAIKLQGDGESNNEEYLRIHIRANSNDSVDQSVKYKVKESIVEYMTPWLDGVTSKESAMEILRAHISSMKAVADDTLAKNGYTYKSRVSLRKEEFPARTYGDLTLDMGVYDALIIELGSGEGDNWWCVVFPPLCFVGEDKDDIEYKSFFQQIFNKIAGK